MANGRGKNGAAAAVSTSASKKPASTTGRRRGARAPASEGFTGSLHCSRSEPLPAEFTAAVQGLEAAFGKTVWCLIQRQENDGGMELLGPHVRSLFFQARDELKKGGPIILLLDSPGGYARETYQLATMLRRHCGEFSVAIPRFAKSAATLLALGSSEIYMGQDAELGPLDAQLLDYEQEERTSALDEVQALERLHSVALTQFDEMSAFLMIRTGKKASTVMPIALDFTVSMMTPLLDKIDTVHYAKQSRVLKVAEDYAVRLLAGKYSGRHAERIASKLVNDYPEHGFVIDVDEARTFMEISSAADEQQKAIDELEQHLTEADFTLIGRLEEI